RGMLAHSRPERAAPFRRNRMKRILAPAEQGRDEQAGKVQIVEWLERGAGGGEQILDGERRRKQQPIDPGYRHPLGMEPRDQQRGALAAATDEGQNVFGPQRAAAAFEMEGPVEPGPDLTGQPRGITAERVGGPAFLPPL